MDFITWLVHIPLLFFCTKKLKSYYQTSPVAGYFYAGIVYKFMAAIAISAVYLYYYQYHTDTYWIYNGFLDVCKYVAEGEFNKAFRFIFFSELPAGYDKQSLLEITFSPRSYYFFLIAFFFLLVSFGNYWIACLYISFISFWAMFALADVLTKKYPFAKLAAVVAFLFWPPVVVWSSGFMKEVPLMIAICVPLICVLQAEFRKVHILYILLSLAIMYLIRPYYWVVYAPLLAIVYLIMYGSALRKQTILFGSIIFAGVMLFCVERLYIYNIFSSDKLLQTIVGNNQIFLTIENSGSNYNGFSDLEPTYTSVILHVPQALWVAFFEPNIVSFRNPQMLLSAICNTILLLLTLYALFLFFRNCLKKVRPLALVTVLYVFILAVFLTLSTPNWGTLERYKVGIMPFYLFGVLYIICRYDKIYFNKYL